MVHTLKAAGLVVWGLLRITVGEGGRLGDEGRDQL